MKVDRVIAKFLDNEALLNGGKAAVREVVAELEAEGVTVSASMVTNIQAVTDRVLAVQRERTAANAQRSSRREAPAEVIGNADKVLRIATGEETE